MFEQVDCDLTDPWTVCVDLYFVGDQEPMMLSISLEAPTSEIDRDALLSALLTSPSAPSVH
jgi:hypothetical protein